MAKTKKGKISSDEQKITTGVPNQESQAQIHRRHNQNNGKHNLDAKIDFLLKSSKITTDSRRSPPSLPHLIIGIEIKFLSHFYSRKYEMKLGSGK
jgi:hypothetical protein